MCKCKKLPHIRYMLVSKGGFGKELEKAINDNDRDAVVKLINEDKAALIKCDAEE